MRTRHAGLLFCGPTLTLLACLSLVPVQAQSQGSWGTGFNHVTASPPAFNDFTQPFQGAGYAGPLPAFAWGAPMYNGRFNAVHMAVIPKGLHQGKVLVWDTVPVLLRPNTTLEPQGRYWSCQAWSILDPGPNGATFRNFLLPLAPVPPPPPTQDATQVVVADLFCTGHAWSQEGDLVVAGGTTAILNGTVIPPALLSATGAKFLFLFDPKALSQAFQGLTNLYAGEVGRWLRAPDLLVDRFYPTVTLSQVITRNGLNNEIVVIFGGFDPNTTSGLGDPRNHYECYVVRNSGHPAGFLTSDPDPTPQTVLPGPVTGAGVSEWFDQYPRFHLLSDGTMFLSGWAHLSSKIDLNVLTPRAWDTTVGRTGSVWPYQRLDGASVFFARVLGGALQDAVVRLGGLREVPLPGSGFQATDTAEFCLASLPNAGWAPLPVASGASTIPGGPRRHLNAVILPDGSVVVIGGSTAAAQPTPVLRTALYRPGIGWQSFPLLPDTPTRRMYHTVAVLLPDGRVLVGGGEGRNANDWDYDIFYPHYLQGSPKRPTILAMTGPNGLGVPTDPLDGTFELGTNQQGFTLACGEILDFDALDRIVLMAPGSMTHHSDMTARYVELPSGAVPNDNSKRTFAIPDSRMLPRGYYMMFALNTGGIPSEAAWVQIF